MTFLQKLRDRVPEIPAGHVTIKIANVAKYMYEYTPQEEWIIDRDFPNLAPPFNKMFFEWPAPKVINTDGVMVPQKVLHERDGKIVQFNRCGILVDVMPRKEGPGWTLIFVGAMMIDDYAGLLNHAVVMLDVEKDGTILHERTEDGLLMAKKVLGIDTDLLQENKEFLGSMMNPALLAISFMHCKNVVIVDHAPTPKTMRKKKGYREIYKTLEIGPLQRLLNVHGAQTTGIKQALHLCRGHFKTYTAEAPLLGKATGTFFWAQQLRGSKAVGVVHKDYSI